MRKQDIGVGADWHDVVRGAAPEWMANGGSCIAGPDGQWVIEPTADVETLLVATLDRRRVLEERQNFDPTGHYSRPDVTRLEVNRRRQRVVEFVE